MRSLKIKLSKSTSFADKILIDFVTTLHNDDSEEDEETYLEYTKRWINKVNRGGLFLICDNLFQTFIA
uniref:Uncharacterized protein n=1 Tax=Amphimedon queenslandica TaxID=400682 RepID=A0A1X7UJK5_AMPQE